MLINSTMKTSLREYKKTIDYWLSKNNQKKKKRVFITNIILGLFPVLGLFLVASIGIVHARHQKSRVYLYLFTGVILYYGSTFGLQRVLGFYTIPIITILWTITTYTLYKKNIVNRF